MIDISNGRSHLHILPFSTSTIVIEAKKTKTFMSMSNQPVDMDFDDGHEHDSNEYDDESFDSGDDSFDSEEELDDAFAMYMEAACEGNKAPDVKKTSMELWNEFLTDQAKVLKLTDACCEKFELGDSTMANEVVQAVITNPGLTHVILGHRFLNMVDQIELLGAIATHHANTLTYLKLTLERGKGGSSLNVNALLTALTSTTKLTELELQNLTLQQSAERQVDMLASILQGSSLRQIYIFGLDVEGEDKQLGKLDPIFHALSTLEPLDELRLEGSGNPTAGSFVSVEALQQLLLEKQKWWRFGLDNMGLGDDHCAVIANMFARDDKYKVGDLLSLKSNPAITQFGYNKLFTVLYRKGRMGLVKVDDASWEAEFDLVRSMNNLHGRLDVVLDGMITSKMDWIDWISRIGASGGWEPDSKKLNYIWFALRDHPGIVEHD